MKNQFLTVKFKELYPKADYPEFVDSKGNSYAYEEAVTRFNEDPRLDIYRAGTVVIDLELSRVAVVLGVVDIEGGDCRIDTDGMQPFIKLLPIPATIKKEYEYTQEYWLKMLKDLYSLTDEVEKLIRKEIK